MKAASESIQGRVLVPGLAAGVVMKLDEGLSFWGGFDPKNGEIIDVLICSTNSALASQSCVFHKAGARLERPQR